MLKEASGHLHLKYLGLADYETVWRAMQEFTDNRTAEDNDECWIVEHHPVYTQGQAGKPEHVLLENTIPVVQSDRGGQVTYHGPGQPVFYWLVNLKNRDMSVRDFVGLMEEVIIVELEEFGIKACLKDGAPGVYVDGAKIASLGLRVRKSCTYHGLSVNFDMDLEPFNAINPCGYPGLEVTQVSALCAEKPEKTAFIEGVVNNFFHALKYQSMDVVDV